MKFAPNRIVRWTVAALGALVLLGGAISMLGWVLDIPRLADWDKTGIAMQPNAAIAAILSGLALCLRSAGYLRPVWLLGFGVAALGAATLTEHLTGANFGIDDPLLFGRTWGGAGTVSPGRMGIPGSLSWILIGTGLLAAGRVTRASAATSALGIMGLVLSGLSIVGYLFGADTLYAVPQVTAIAQQTAIIIFAASMALVVANPDGEPFRTVLADSAAGDIARRALPLIVLVPVLLGLLRVKGQEAGLYDTAMGTAMLVLALIILLCGVLWWGLVAVHRRERALAVLEETRVRADVVLNAARDQFHVVDRDWRYLFVNERVVEITGRPRGDFIGHTFWEIWPQVGGTPLEAALRRAMEQRAFETLEFHFAPWDRWFDCRIYPAANGGISLLALEITDRKRAEQASEQSADRFRRAAEAVNGIIYEYDLQTGVVERTRGLKEVLGYRPEEIPADSKWWWNQIHPDDLPDTADEQRLLARAGDRIVTEYRVRHKDGRWLHVEDRSVVMKDAAGQPLKLIGCTVDVSDRKRAEIDARRRSEQVRRLAEVAARLNTLHDIPSIMGVVNAEARDIIGAHQSVIRMAVGGDWGRSRVVTSLSDKYAAWRRYEEPPDGSGIYRLVCETGQPMRLTQAEVVAHPAWKAFGRHADLHPPLRGWLAAPLTRLPDGNQGLIQMSDKYEDRDFTADDESVLVQLAQMTSVALSNAWLLDELRAADRRKDEFLATLAHELRNPLAPIQNSLELMKCADADAAEVERSRGLIERQIRHMVRLVDDLLDVSRITRDKLELRKEPVDLTALLRLKQQTYQPSAAEAGQKLVFDLPAEPVLLEADPVRLAQVFGNLLTNAIKYTPSGGRIELALFRDGGDAVVCVQDTGVGLSPEQIPRVFDMFTQIDRSLEGSRGGLGIGLTISKRLVELHGGAISVRSPGPGKGAEFTVRIPLAKAPPAPQAPGPAETSATTGSALRILVVDDNRDSAATMARLLEHAGHATELAFDGEEALAKAESYRPDAILLDIGLPKINGYEVCRAIRAADWGRSLRLIAITGWGQEEDRRKSREAGFDTHLVKPVQYAALLAALFATAPTNATNGILNPAERPPASTPRQ